MVNRGRLYAIRVRKGIPQDLVKPIKSLYVENELVIESDNPKTTAFNVGNIDCVVRQGCPLSSALFNLYMDDVVKRWHTRLPENFMIGNSEIDTLLFANDQAILSISKNRFQMTIRLLE